MTKLYVGVDWHKRTSTWVAINEERKKVFEKVWECTPEAVQAAISSLPTKPNEMKLAVEPVCGRVQVVGHRGAFLLRMRRPPLYRPDKDER